MRNRNMFYQNINEGYQNPGMFIPPSGYNMNTQFESYGPNNIQSYQNNLEDRLTLLEKQIKSIDNRIQKLESKGIDTTDNFYMI